MERNIICEEHIQHTFDYYCKKVIKNEAINMQKKDQIERKKFVSLSEIENYNNKLAVLDEYLVDYCRYKVLGCEIDIKHDGINEVLEQLSPVRRNIVLLSFYFNYTDRQISEELDMPRSSVQYQRIQGLKFLKERLLNY